MAAIEIRGKKLPGVRRVRNLWQGRIMVDGKRICSQGFDTKEQAAQWREAQIAHYRDKRVTA